MAQVGADAVKSKALQDLSDRAISYVSSAGTVALVGQSKLKGGGERQNPISRVRERGLLSDSSHKLPFRATLHWLARVPVCTNITLSRARVSAAEDPVIARYNPGDDLVFEIQVFFNIQFLVSFTFEF